MTKLKEKPKKVEEQEEPKDKFDSKEILMAVLRQLGRPNDMVMGANLTRVTQIGSSSARVVIVCKEGFGYKYTDSFYLKLSPEGEIVSSNPPIVKRY